MEEIYNEVKLQGEVTFVNSKEKFVKVSMKVNKKKGFTFITVTGFGDTADKMRKFEKGDVVKVKGEINTSSYEKDGKKIYSTDVIAEVVGKVG